MAEKMGPKVATGKEVRVWLGLEERVSRVCSVQTL